jgi:sugar O-acyltransferase (sialic acid O-acetyltransferase NeuD family)
MSTLPPIVVFGASGFAKTVIDVIERAGRHRIAGFIDVQRAAGTTFCGYPVLGDDDDAARLFATLSLDAAAIAIGDNWRRHLVVERVQRAVPRVSFPALLDPTVLVARGATVGRGTIAMHGTVVGCDASVGAFVFCDYYATIGHDCTIGDFATLGSKAATAGGVAIGAFSMLGVSAAVIHGLSIGAHTVIGAGSTVVRGIGDRVVALGTPAAVVRRREIGDAYL